MPTLNWIGKVAVLNHHQDVPYKTLEQKYTFPECAAESENKIIHGDNLEALKALLPEYEGRIKCIYIDPPYNTGNENWVYNDNVNSPKIQKWLGQVVGKEAEDLSRHDKWLCMMYPRLQLLQKLLADDGAIFISIDDNEQSNLKLICDEIFGAGNFVGTWFWKRTNTPPALSYKIRRKLEFVVCYQKTNIPQRKYVQGFVDGGDAPLLNSGNPLGVLKFPIGSVCFNIPDGVYKKIEDGKIKLITELLVKDGVNNNEFKAEGHFKWGQNNLLEEISNGTFLLVKSKQFSIRYQKKEKATKVPANIIDGENNVGTNEDAMKILEMLGMKDCFNFAKPQTLIEYLIKMAFWEDKSSIILDSFAGSGTTAHAVLNLNKQDGGNRQFILVEMEDYAENITAERVRRVIKGYGEGKNAVEGTGGSFSYYELGEALFKDDKNLNEAVGVEKIRKYIWYSETHTPYVAPENTNYFLGTHNTTDYYFYYEPDRITTLSYDTLNIVMQKAEQYVIYADCCLIDKNDLLAKNIIFKKIPRDIRRF